MDLDQELEPSSPSRNGNPRVAVVGGGWAGLTAAVELSAAGYRVAVFEAGRQLGGRARDVLLNGRQLDNGQHILIGAYRETLRLMDRVGARPTACLKRVRLDLNHPAVGFRLRLTTLPAPLHLAAGLVTAQGCTWREKWAAARFMRRLQSADYRVEPDISVRRWLDAHGQHGKLRTHLWEPLCISALNTPPEQASGQVFANVLRDTLGGRRADTDILLPTTNLGDVFPHAAARFIQAYGGEIRLAQRVTTIDASMEVKGERFSAIVLATAPQHAVAILNNSRAGKTLASTLADYTYEPIATAYLCYPPEIRLPFPMLGLDAIAPGRYGQWVFDRGALCGDRGMLSFVLSAHGNWETLGNEALSTALHRELQEALGKPLPQPMWSRVIREQRATYACRPNLPRPSARTVIDGLWLAGDYTCADYPATLEAAVRSGVHAARGVTEWLSA